MNSWGYHDWVNQERERLASYERMITNIAQQISMQMARQQATTFTKASTTQQLEAIIEFVEKKIKEMEGWEEGGQEDKAKKRKTKKEEAQKLLEEMESGTGKEKPLESNISRMKLLDEVMAAERAKDGLDLKELINDAKFQQIYEDKRDAELRGVLREIVPAKMSQVADVMKAGRGGEKVNLSKYDIAIQTALVSAYRKSLEEYGPKPGRGG